MSLLLTVYNTPIWKTFVDASGLHKLPAPPVSENVEFALLEPTQTATKISELLTLLNDTQSLWIAVVQLEHFIASELDSGNTLAEAAERWEAHTTELLNLHRQHRTKLNLFNLHQALRNPIQFRQLLGNPINLNELPIHEEKSTFSLMAACQFTSQTPALQAINTRLQASCRPLCESEAITLDIEHILREKHAAAVKSHNDESELYSAQAFLLQEQLEKSQISINSLQSINHELEKAVALKQQENTQLNEIVNHLKLANSQYQAEAKTATNERDLALIQLGHVQEELENYYAMLQTEQQNNKHALLARDKQHKKEIENLEADLRKCKARAAGAEYKNQCLEQELFQLHNSTSWKTAKPIRAVGRLFKRQNQAKGELLQQTALILTSEYFDVDWYLKAYPDVAESGMNPAEHYLLFGADEGRLPSPHFDGNWYLQQYPDIAKEKLNPLLHFVKFGQQEGRRSSPKLLTQDKEI